MTTRSAVMESELIKCRKCGLTFGEDEAEICRRCHEHICPKCSCCGCLPPEELYLRARFA